MATNLELRRRRALALMTYLKVVGSVHDDETPPATPGGEEDPTFRLLTEDGFILVTESGDPIKTEV